MNVVGTEAAQFPEAIHKWIFFAVYRQHPCGTLCKNATSIFHKSLIEKIPMRKNCGCIKGAQA